MMIDSENRQTNADPPQSCAAAWLPPCYSGHVGNVGALIKLQRVRTAGMLAHAVPVITERVQ